MNESRLKSSVILRMLIVAALTLLLLVPAVFVHILVSERSERRDSATVLQLEPATSGLSRWRQPHKSTTQTGTTQKSASMTTSPTDGRLAVAALT